jgi:hypothetical protein
MEPSIGASATADDRHVAQTALNSSQRIDRRLKHQDWMSLAIGINARVPKMISTIGCFERSR